MYFMPTKNHRQCQQQLMLNLVSSSNLEIYVSGLRCASGQKTPQITVLDRRGYPKEDCLKMSQKTQQKRITPAEKKWMATSFSHYCRPEPYQ